MCSLFSRIIPLPVIILAIGVSPVLGQPTPQPLTTSGYFQNFDSMSTGGATSDAPDGWAVLSYRGTTLPGIGATQTFTAANSTGGAYNNRIDLSLSPGIDYRGPQTVNNAPTTTNNNGFNASANTADGTRPVSDRILATSPTGTAAAAIEVRLTNNTGVTLNSVGVGYDIYRINPQTNVSAPIDDLVGYQLFYSVNGGTFINVDTLNPGVAGSTGSTSPFLINPTGANGRTTVPETFFNFTTSLNAGDVLALRWVDDNEHSATPDQILGLDNVIIRPVPEPSILLAFTAAGLAAAGRVRRVVRNRIAA